VDNAAGVYRSTPAGWRHVLSDEPPPADAELVAPSLTNALRRQLAAVRAQVQIASPDANQRLAGARAMAEKPAPEADAVLRTALAQEHDASVRHWLRLAVAQLDLQSADPALRLAAVTVLGEAGRLGDRALIVPLAGDTEVDASVRAAAVQALSRIDRQQWWVHQAANLFYGLSLGSILLLSALGLAITFGLMGVINMAHGEMLMLGAYTTYVVQRLFQSQWPAWQDAYLLAAIPAAFAVAALVGVALERLVIRHLYGRPLETLLATWGISLGLIQAVRLVFGAQNVSVANPSWLMGGWAVADGLVLTYNRLAIIVFALAVLSMAFLLLQRTSLGLTVRAVTQNRPMAAAMGINTASIDAWTFGLGSGIAGLGGVALSQIDNVAPDLGQGYIVDSFMVVVLGGVGQLAGTFFGAFGLGLLTKFLEPEIGAVLGKVLVLVLIILFIQRRPQGLFAQRGRAVEA
jgi:urea transport system permease protein